MIEQQIPSPKGKDRWTQPVISNILSNQTYIGYIVSFDDFFLVQGEKGRRSNIDEDTNKQKATRYNSPSVLSGLLVCAECNHNYRRITRTSGEIVWRCANRVEYGKKFCKHSPSIAAYTGLNLPHAREKPATSPENFRHLAGEGCQCKRETTYCEEHTKNV